MKTTLSILLGIFMMSNLAAKNKFQPHEMWTYKKVGDKELQLSAFLPENYKTGGPFPTIVIFHGGSWNAGSPNWHYRDCEYWARRGMIAVSVDYRLRDRGKVQVPLECVKDAKSAVRYLRKNAKKLKVDPNKIVCAGGSAGAQLAAATSMIEGKHGFCNGRNGKNPFFYWYLKLADKFLVDNKILSGKDVIIIPEKVKVLKETDYLAFD